MKRRSVISLLHWSTVLLLLAMIKGGTAVPWVLWLFVIIVAIWGGITLTKGLLGKPGPKLSPPLRRAYPWMHRILHLSLALTAIAVLLRLIGTPLPWLDAWTMLLITLGLGTFHGVFHFWRHTALYDNALHLITPKAMHKWL
jgi:cytochrome b561